MDGPEAGDTQGWSFDAVGRVTKITENAADRSEWLYNLAGQQTKLTYGSGSYATRLYDGAGRLTSLAHKKSDNSVIQSFAYLLDDVGNRTKLTLDGGDYVEYSYDPLHQLTQEHHKASGGSTQYRNDFYYDYISNRTQLVHNDGTSDTTTTYSYNAADQLTRDVTGATTTDYSYDANGALTRKSSGGSNFDYLYDARSLITKHDAPGTDNDTIYNWDLFKRRVKKDLNGTVTRFLYDHSIGEIIAEYDGSGTPVHQASYVPTGLDSNVSMTRTDDVHYFHADAIQSTWNLTLATDESVQNTYAYQAFGSLHGSATENVTNTRRFTGAEWNTEDSTQTHGVRRLLLAQGRWNHRDWVYGIADFSIYNYVKNNPNLYIDPSGKSPVVGGVIIGLVLAAYACGKPQHDIAHERYPEPDWDDNFRHCWVSCRIGKSCGNIIAQLAGFGKEAIDEAIREYCRVFPDHDICQGGHGDYWDALGDIAANQDCLYWEDYVFGICGSWVGAIFRESCEECCGRAH